MLPKSRGLSRADSNAGIVPTPLDRCSVSPWTAAAEEAAAGVAAVVVVPVAAETLFDADQAWLATLAASWQRINTRVLIVDFMSGRAATTERSLSTRSRSVAASSVTLYESMSRHNSRY